jgi:hypothetical protein
VAPGKHVFDDGVVDFALFFRHLQDFVLEGLLEVFQYEAGNADESTVGKKAAVGRDGVQVGIEVEKERRSTAIRRIRRRAFGAMKGESSGACTKTPGIFVAAMVASNPGEAASQVAAVQIAIDHVLYIWTPESVSGRVHIVPDAFQFLEPIFHAAVERAVLWVSRLVDPGDVVVRSRHGESPFGCNPRLRMKTKMEVPILDRLYCIPM